VTIPAALQGVTRLCIDSSPLIYLLENHPVYAALVEAIFDYAAENGVHSITSAITVTEVLTQPKRNNDHSLVATYRQFLTGTPDELTIYAIDISIAETAADIRARYGAKTPDAIQIATAIVSRSQAFLTNDRNLKRVSGVQIILLDDLTKWNTLTE